MTFLRNPAWQPAAMYLLAICCKLKVGYHATALEPTKRPLVSTLWYLALILLTLKQVHCGAVHGDSFLAFQGLFYPGHVLACCSEAVPVQAMHPLSAAKSIMAC